MFYEVDIVETTWLKKDIYIHYRIILIKMEKALICGNFFQRHLLINFTSI